MSLYTPLANVPTMYYNVRDYGALGDGATNDAPAIQAAIDAAEAAGGGTVFFPRGYYKVGAMLTVETDGVWLVGSGRLATRVEKTGNFALIRISGATGAGSNHTTDCGVKAMSLRGGDFTGVILDLLYVTRGVFEDLHLFGNNDAGIDMVEVWDSRFTNVWVEWCTSTTVPAVWVRSSRAASGFGSSTDSTNQVVFVGCLIETWKVGAVWIEQGVGTPENIYGIHFYGTKIETHLVRGPAVVVGSGASNINFADTYVFLNSFDTGFSTPVDAISIAGNKQIDISGCYIANGAATIASGVNVQNGGVSLDNIEGYYAAAAPTTGIHVRFTSGTDFSTGHIRATNATTLVSGLSTTVQANMGMPIRAVAGVVSDASFPSIPPIGTQAVDVTNSRLYVKTAAATWKSVVIA